LSSSISPMDINLSMLNKEDYEVAASDSLVPLPELEHFKKPQSTDWEILFSDDKFLDRLTFMYIAHINLQRVHQGALDQLMESKAKIESLLNLDD